MKLYTFEEVKNLKFDEFVVMELLNVTFTKTIVDDNDEAKWININDTPKIIISPFSDFKLTLLSGINWNDYLIYSIICGRLHIINKKYYDIVKNNIDFINYIEDEQGKWSSIIQ